MVISDQTLARLEGVVIGLVLASLAAVATDTAVYSLTSLEEVVSYVQGESATPV